MERVRTWLSWLLMFGVIAGLSGRMIPDDHPYPQEHVKECCGHDCGSDDGDHSPDCPPGSHDHHSHACCHPLPLAGVEMEYDRVPVPAHSWLGVTCWTALPPEGPVFELDKPPLI